MKYRNLGWYTLLAAMIGDIVFSSIFASFYKEYNWVAMDISTLGNPQSPVAGIFNIWMLVEGILFLISLPMLFYYFKQVSKRMTYLLLIVICLFAIGACIFTYFFSVNEAKDIVTTASIIHEAGSSIGFMAFLLVPLLLSLLFKKLKNKAMTKLSLISFIIALIFFILFVMSEDSESVNTVSLYMGLWQRLNLIFMYLPLIVLSIRNILHKKI